MSKMLELLAVESAINGSYNKIVQETLHVLGRPDLFSRTVSKKEYFSEDDQKLNTSETKDITTTVMKRLTYFAEEASRLYDVIASKDATNQTAKADVILPDGTVLVTGVSATTLLSLESKLQEVRSVIDATPTLSSGVIWNFDANEGLFRAAEDKVTFATKRTMKPVVLYDATDKHPAQVKEVQEDVPVAKITVSTSSGMLTSVRKSELLAKVDVLLRAVKTARQRANSTEVVDQKIGRTIFDYILKE